VIPLQSTIICFAAECLNIVIKESAGMTLSYQDEIQSGKQVISLSTREAYELLNNNDAVLLDIRPEYETDFRVFDVPQIYYLPFDTYHEKLNAIPKEVFLIIADSVGNRSVEVARYMLGQGYSKVACLAGGIVAWDRAGLPLSKDKDYEMVGGCACRLKPQKAKVEGSIVAPKQNSI
jgi:rhodanese-related sulfurtransferase